MPNHERITRSSRTAPVAGSTFSAPKKWTRAATVSLLAAPAAPGQASAAGHAAGPGAGARERAGREADPSDHLQAHREVVVPQMTEAMRRTWRRGVRVHH